MRSILSWLFTIAAIYYLIKVTDGWALVVPGVLLLWWGAATLRRRQPPTLPPEPLARVVQINRRKGGR